MGAQPHRARGTGLSTPRRRSARPEPVASRPSGTRPMLVGSNDGKEHAPRPAPSPALYICTAMPLPTRRPQPSTFRAFVVSRGSMRAAFVVSKAPALLLSSSSIGGADLCFGTGAGPGMCAQGNPSRLVLAQTLGCSPAARRARGHGGRREQPEDTGSRRRRSHRPRGNCWGNRYAAIASAVINGFGFPRSLLLPSTTIVASRLGR